MDHVEPPEEDKFDALHSVRLAVLSRLVEVIRFTSGYSYIPKQVTMTSLIDAFHDHDKIVGDTSEVQMESRSKELRKIWWSMDRHCKPLSAEVTFGYLFDFEYPMFPETTKEIREKLRELGRTQEMISKEHVQEVLMCEADDQSLDFIFASGAPVLPSEVYNEVVACLDRHPAMIQFTPVFVSTMAERGKRMQPFLFYLVLLIMIITIAPGMSPRDYHVAHENIMHFGDNDWETGCPAGAGVAPDAVAPHTCNLLGKHFFTVNKPDIDVMQYARRQIIIDLWPKENPGELNETLSDARASETPLGNVWLKGSLLLRYARQTHVGVTGNSSGCKKLHLSQRTPHFEINGYYDCDSIWDVAIPFNATRSEALELARHGVQELPQTPQTEHTAVIAQFVGVVPSAEAVVHGQFILSLPKGGGVLPRAHVTVFGRHAAETMLPILVVKIISTVWEVAWVVVFAKAGIPWYDDWAFYADIATTVIGISAYSTLAVVTNPEVAKITQNQFFPEDVDYLADVHSAGMSIAGFFFTVTILCLLRFARDIRGLDFLYDILRTAMIEILATVGIFIVWCFGFVAVGMLLLGATVEQYSSVRLAWQTLMLFFFNHDDYEHTTGNNPLIGTIFFFLYSVFVVFFALNVLIAIITAPLTLIRGQRSIIEVVLDQVHTKLPPDVSSSFFFLKRYFLWPLINVVSCSLPLRKERWFHMQRAMRTFYEPQRTELTANDSITNAARIARLVFGDPDGKLDFLISSPNVSVGTNPLVTNGTFTNLEHEQSSGAFGRALTQTSVDVSESLPAQTTLTTTGWDSPLVHTVIADALIYPDSTLALVLATIAAETPFTIVRDARLLLALRKFSDFDHEMKKVLNLQLHLAGACAQQTEAVTELLAPPRMSDLRSRRQSAVDDRRQSTMTRKSNPGVIPEICVIQPQSSVFAPQEQDAESPTEPPTNVTGTEEPGDDEKTAFFLGIVDARISNSNQFLFYAITTLIFTLYYFVPYFSHEDDTAWLTRSLNAQLLYGDMSTSCKSLKCNNSLTFNKTFDNTGDMTEYIAYLEDGMSQNLWYRQEHGLPGGSTNALWWDSRVTLHGPITFRQLRHKETECGDFINSITEPLSFSGPVCFEQESSASRFDHEFLKDGNTSVPSTFHNLDAYQYRSGCKDAYALTYWGKFDDYPCEGFQVDIHNRSELRELIASGWFDTRTVLVSATGEYRYGNDTSVKYSQLVEFSTNGGGAKPKVFSALLKSSSTLRNLTVRLIVVYIVVVAHALWWAALQGRYLFRRYITKRAVEECILLRPEIPVWTLGMLLWLVVGTNAIFPDPDDPNRALAVGLSSVLYIMYTFSTQNMFPIASLVSKEVLTLVVTLFRALVQVFYVLPFFLVFITAFAIGGIVIFGRSVPEFSSPRWSFLQVSFFTFTSNFDMHVMQRGRPQEAQIWAVVMLFSILITLNNVFLAIVTSACGDAQFTKGNVGLSELLMRRFGKHVIYGKFVGSVLTLMRFIADEDEDGASNPLSSGAFSQSVSNGNLTSSQESIGALKRTVTVHRRGSILPKILRFLLPRFVWAPRHFDVAKCTATGRLLFPIESMLTTFPPLRANEVLRHMRHRKASNLAFAAMVPFVLEAHNEYRSSHPKRSHEDDELNKQQEIAVAAAIVAFRPPPPDPILRPSLSVVFGSGVFAQPSLGSAPPSSPFSHQIVKESSSGIVQEDSGSEPLRQGVDPTISVVPPPGIAPLQMSAIEEAARVVGDTSSSTFAASSTMSSNLGSVEAGWALFRKHCRSSGVKLPPDLWQRLRESSMDDMTKITLMEVFDEFFDTIDTLKSFGKKQSTFLSDGLTGGSASSRASTSSQGGDGKRRRGQGNRGRKKKKVNFGNVML